MYCVDVAVQELRFADYALGRPFHAAVLRLGSRTTGTGVHGHADYYEFVHVRSGHGRHQVGGQVQRLSVGDVVLVRPGDYHALVGSSPDGIEFVNIAFSAVAWRTYVDLLGLDEPRAWDRLVLPPVFPMRGNQAARVRAAFDRTLTVFHEQPSMLDAVRLWTAVVAAAGVPELCSGRHGAERMRPTWLSRACAAMQDEENMRGGVVCLLRLASVSPGHLSRTVRRYYGRTPSQFVMHLRLTHAQKLLATTTEQITVIAHRCGFASQSYFSRCFRAAEGCSPREFRERARRAFVP
ncbi:MAG: helix-turn-helix domain-containing protein [Actinophytocola sp.]|nr:helix-turn-helix domain-containing protein [Actinophytocola sp.]